VSAYDRTAPRSPEYRCDVQRDYGKALSSLRLTVGERRCNERLRKREEVHRHVCKLLLTLGGSCRLRRFPLPVPDLWRP
jgi:hypothetical protein